jgi:hypothetical protein
MIIITEAAPTNMENVVITRLAKLVIDELSTPVLEQSMLPAAPLLSGAELLTPLTILLETPLLQLAAATVPTVVATAAGIMNISVADIIRSCLFIISIIVLPFFI